MFRVIIAATTRYWDGHSPDGGMWNVECGMDSRNGGTAKQGNMEHSLPTTLPTSPTCLTHSQSPSWLSSHPSAHSRWLRSFPTAHTRFGLSTVTLQRDMNHVRSISPSAFHCSLGRMEMSASHVISLQKPTLYYFSRIQWACGVLILSIAKTCNPAWLLVCSFARSLGLKPLLSLLNLLVLLFLAQRRILARLRDILSLLDSWSSGDTVYPGLFQQISQMRVGLFR